MQLADLIALASMMRPAPGPQIPALDKSASNVTANTMSRAALNNPPQSDPAEMLASMIAAARTPSEVELKTAQAGQAGALADALRVASQGPPESMLNMFGGMGGGAGSAVAPIMSRPSSAGDDGSNPFGLPPGPLRKVADAVWNIESGRSMDGGLRGSSGEHGPMQIMPATGAQYGATDKMLRDAGTNLKVGGAIIGDLAKRYGGDPEAIAVGYNAGPGRADKWLAAGRDPSVLPKVTQDYLVKLRQELGGGAGQSAAMPAAVPFGDMAPAIPQDALRWALTQDAINPLLGKRNPTSVDELIKMRFAGPAEAIKRGAGLPFIGPESAAKKGGEFPFESQLQTERANLEMRNKMAEPTTEMKEYDAYTKDQQQRGEPALSLFQWGQQRRSATANNIIQRVEGQGQAALVKESLDSAKTAFAGEMDANRRTQTYAQMAEAMQGFTPGATAALRLRATRILKDLGITSGDNVAPQEIFRQAATRLQITAQPKGQGQVSNFERELFMQAVPQMTDSPESIAKAIGIAKRLDDYDRQVARIHREVAKENGNLPNFIVAQERISALGPPLSEGETNALERLRDLNKTSAAGQGGASAPAAGLVRTKDDYDKLAPGTSFIAPDGSRRVKPPGQ